MTSVGRWAHQPHQARVISRLRLGGPSSAVLVHGSSLGGSDYELTVLMTSSTDVLMMGGVSGWLFLFLQYPSIQLQWLSLENPFLSDIIATVYRCK